MDHASKIQALLRKAESTTPEEAELLIAKAQELMSMYAIDEAMLAHGRKQQIDEIVEEQVHYHSTYSRAQFEIGAAIARANDCRVLIRKGRDLMHTTLYVVGFKSDVETVKLLNSSLQIQAMNSMNQWYRARNYVPSNQREKFKLRREFLFSFASGLSYKLKLAKEAGRTQATANERKRSSLTADEAVDKVALVLASKEQRVERYMTERYGGRTRKARAARFAGGDFDAQNSGHAAGRAADTSTPRPRKGLPSERRAIEQ